MLPGFTPATPRSELGNDQFTKLLLHFDTVNSPSTIIDSSPAQHGYANVGGTVTLENATGMFGSAASLHNAGGGYLTFPNSNDWEFGAGDFTVDWWEYRTGTGVAITRDLSTVYCPFLLNWTSAGEIYMTSTGNSWDIANGAAGLPSPGFGAATLNTWTHFAVTRKGSTFRAFKNGVQVSTWTSSASIIASGNALCIGAGQNGNNYQGYIDEIRISKGIARWTANFTPPSIAYGPNCGPDLNTKLLMHFDSKTTVTDSSIYKHGAATVIGSGIGTTGAQTKFGDGSCVFPGAGQYLQFADSTDWNTNADCTVECWVRLNVLPASGAAFGIANQTDGTTNYWVIYIDQNGNCAVGIGPGALNVYGPGSMTINQWHHIAFVRSAGIDTLYVDGVGGSPTAIAASVDIASPLSIGMWSGTWFLNGYIDEFRISNVARYKNNFTPPTQPYST